NGHGMATFAVPLQLGRNAEVTILDQASVAQFNGAVGESATHLITERGPGTLGFGGGGSRAFTGPVNLQGGTAALSDATLTKARVNLSSATVLGAGTVDGISSVNGNNTVSPGTASTPGTLHSTSSVSLDDSTTLVIKLRATD